MFRSEFFKGLLLVFGSTFLTLIILEIAFRFLPVYDSLQTQPVNVENPIAHYQPHLDFTYSTGWAMWHSNRGRTNNAGFVNDQDYVEGGKNLLAIIGDSFVEALVVPYAGTIQGRLATDLGDRARVYSFAMSRSALPQYLMYAKFACEKYQAKSLVFVIVGNDFDESHYDFRTDAWTGRLHYFRETPDKKLELFRTDYQPTSGRALLRRSALLRYLYFNLHADQTLKDLFKKAPEKKDTKFVGNTSTEITPRREEVSIRSMEKFFELLPEYTQLSPDRILFVVDGLRPQVYLPETLKEASQSYFGVMREKFIKLGREKHYEMIDLNPLMVETFKKNGKRFEQEHDYHWSAEGHGLAAEAVKHSQMFQKFSAKLQ